MKTSALSAAAPFANLLGHKRTALALAVIVTLLAALAMPARAQDNAPAAALATSSNELPPVNHLVYLAKLPSPSSLMKEAKAQGTTVERIDRTDDSVVVIYKYADGHTDSFGYTTLDAASTQDEPAVVASPATAAGQTPAPTTITTVQSQPTYAVVSQPQPAYTVVYSQPAPVYYAPRYGYYDPIDNFWGPLALGVGIGWSTGWHGGGYHGSSGYHGRGGWHH